MEHLSVEKFKILVKAMKAVYPQPTFIPDEDAFKVWYSLLKDIDYTTLQSAIQKYMMLKTFPPTIADLRNEAMSFKEKKYDDKMGELEAWALVRKALGNSGYHSEEEYERLPEAVQKAVGAPSNLKEWALASIDTVDSVIQSHFVRNYRSAITRMSETSKLSVSVVQRIQEYRPQEISEKETKEIDGPKEEKEMASSEYVSRLMREFKRKIG